jgi:hypothetical protein
MATDCIPQVTFEFEKSVVARFDAPQASTDGGAVLLLELIERHGHRAPTQVRAEAIRRAA